MTNLLKSKIYDVTLKYSNARFRDEDWSYVFKMIEAIKKEVEAFNINHHTSFDCYIESSKYRQSADRMTTYKEYVMKIEDANTNSLSFYIDCHPCGTVENPFSLYDMTINC